MISGIQFDPIGFYLPLCVGLVLLILFGFYGNTKVFTFGVARIAAPMFVLIALFTWVSYTSLPLQRINPHGVGVDVPVLVLVGVYQVYFVTWRYYRFAFSISYLMGFVVGLSSDLSGLSHLNGYLNFGGSGITDVDFCAPILMMGLTVLSILFMRYAIPNKNGLTRI